MIRQRWSFPTIHADFICKLLLNEIGQIWKTGIVKKKKKKKKILAGHPKASEHNSTWGNHTCIFQGVEQRRLCWMSRISLSVVWRPQRSQMLSSIYSCPPVWSLLKLTVVPGCQFIHFLLFLQKCNFPPFLLFFGLLWSSNTETHMLTVRQVFESSSLQNAYFDYRLWNDGWIDGQECLKCLLLTATVGSYFGFLPADSEDPYCMMSVWSASPKRPTENPGGQTLALKVSWWLLSWDNFKVNV